jgi:hypothetical protein
VIPTFSDIFRKSVCYAQNGCAAGDTAALSDKTLHNFCSNFFVAIFAPKYFACPAGRLYVGGLDLNMDALSSKTRTGLVGKTRTGLD